MFYLYIDGVKQPTPYIHYSDAQEAMNELMKKYRGTVWIEIVCE